ncbi:MAG: hypothetical protein M3273_04075, partial [Actinomycetota bacterium]|nr:hypothetical protein [Actinomycetota bacterium]
MHTERMVDELFGAPLDEFTARRNALSAELAKSGDGAAAARVKKLKKPPLSAWAVNQLARTEARDMARLLELLDLLRDAESAGEIHDLGAERRELIARMARRAGEILDGAGHAASPAVLARITQTLQAGGEEDERSSLRRGVLSRDLAPTGFDALAGAPLTDAATRHTAERSGEAERLAQLAAEAEAEAARLT